MKVDWQSLATELGTITKYGNDYGGSDLGIKAIEHVLGADFFEQAVEHYISCKPGSELARSVLLRLKPWTGMKHCYHIFKHSDDIGDRRSAVELLRVVADGRVLGWIPEFLNDPDDSIQNWGIEVIDQLLFGQLVDDKDVYDVLTDALTHDNPHVRELANRLMTEN